MRREKEKENLEEKAELGMSGKYKARGHEEIRTVSFLISLFLILIPPFLSSSLPLDKAFPGRIS